MEKLHLVEEFSLMTEKLKDEHQKELVELRTMLEDDYNQQVLKISEELRDHYQNDIDEKMAKLEEDWELEFTKQKAEYDQQISAVQKDQWNQCQEAIERVTLDAEDQLKNMKYAYERETAEHKRRIQELLEREAASEVEGREMEEKKSQKEDEQFERIRTLQKQLSDEKLGTETQIKGAEGKIKDLKQGHEKEMEQLRTELERKYDCILKERKDEMKKMYQDELDEKVARVENHLREQYEEELKRTKEELHESSTTLKMKYEKQVSEVVGELEEVHEKNLQHELQKTKLKKAYKSIEDEMRKMKEKMATTGKKEEFGTREQEELIKENENAVNEQELDGKLSEEDNNELGYFAAAEEAREYEETGEDGKELQQKVNELSSQLTFVEEKLARNEKEKSDLVSQHKQDIVNLKTSYEKEILKRNTELENQNTSIAEKEAMVSRQQTTIMDRDASISTLESFSSTYKTKVSELEQELSQLRTVIVQNEGNITEQETKMVELKNIINDKDLRVAELEEEVKEKDTMILEKQDTLLDMKKIEEQEIRVRNLEESVEEKDGKMAELELKVRKQQTVISQQQKMIVDFQKTEEQGKEQGTTIENIETIIKDETVLELEQLKEKEITIFEQQTTIAELKEMEKERIAETQLTDAKVIELESKLEEKEFIISEQRNAMANLEKTEQREQAKGGMENLEETIKNNDAKLGELELKIQEQASIISEQQQTIIKSEKTEKEQQQSVLNLKRTLEEKDNNGVKLEAHIKQQDDTISEQKETIAKMETINKDNDAKVCELESKIEEKDGIILEQETISELEGTKNANLEGIIKHKDKEIAQLDLKVKEQKEMSQRVEKIIQDKDKHMSQFESKVTQQDVLISEYLSTISDLEKTSSARELEIANLILQSPSSGNETGFEFSGPAEERVEQLEEEIAQYKEKLMELEEEAGDRFEPSFCQKCEESASREEIIARTKVLVEKIESECEEKVEILKKEVEINEEGYQGKVEKLENELAEERRRSEELSKLNKRLDYNNNLMNSGIRDNGGTKGIKGAMVEHSGIEEGERLPVGYKGLDFNESLEVKSGTKGDMKGKFIAGKEDMVCEIQSVGAGLRHGANGDNSDLRSFQRIEELKEEYETLLQKLKAEILEKDTELSKIVNEKDTKEYSVELLNDKLRREEERCKEMAEMAKEQRRKYEEEIKLMQTEIEALIKENKANENKCGLLEEFTKENTTLQTKVEDLEKSFVENTRRHQEEVHRLHEIIKSNESLLKNLEEMNQTLERTNKENKLQVDKLKEEFDEKEQEYWVEVQEKSDSFEHERNLVLENSLEEKEELMSQINHLEGLCLKSYIFLSTDDELELLGEEERIPGFEAGLVNDFQWSSRNDGGDMEGYGWIKKDETGYYGKSIDDDPDLKYNGGYTRIEEDINDNKGYYTRNTDPNSDLEDKSGLQWIKEVQYSIAGDQMETERNEKENLKKELDKMENYVKMFHSESRALKETLSKTLDTLEVVKKEKDCLSKERNHNITETAEIIEDLVKYEEIIRNLQLGNEKLEKEKEILLKCLQKPENFTRSGARFLENENDTGTANTITKYSREEARHSQKRPPISAQPNDDTRTEIAHHKKSKFTKDSMDRSKSQSGTKQTNSTKTISKPHVHSAKESGNDARNKKLLRNFDNSVNDTTCTIPGKNLSQNYKTTSPKITFSSSEGLYNSPHSFLTSTTLNSHRTSKLLPNLSGLSPIISDFEQRQHKEMAHLQENYQNEGNNSSFYYNDDAISILRKLESVDDFQESVCAQHPNVFTKENGNNAAILRNSDTGERPQNTTRKVKQHIHTPFEKKSTSELTGASFDLSDNDTIILTTADPFGRSQPATWAQKPSYQAFYANEKGNKKHKAITVLSKHDTTASPPTKATNQTPSTQHFKTVYLIEKRKIKQNQPTPVPNNTEPLKQRSNAQTKYTNTPSNDKLHNNFPNNNNTTISTSANRVDQTKQNLNTRQPNHQATMVNPPLKTLKLHSRSRSADARLFSPSTADSRLRKIEYQEKPLAINFEDYVFRYRIKSSENIAALRDPSPAELWFA